MLLRGMVASKALGMETGLSIIAPDHGMPGTHDKPGCCYLLHGVYANHENWTTYSMLPVYARDYNIVFVMPEAGRSFYTDLRYGQKFFSYVADELPRIVAKTFNITTGREQTSIMGGSMGGFGAICIALRRPDRFAHCGAFGSAALFLKQFMDGIKGENKGRALKELLGPQLAEDFRCMLGDDFTVPPELDLPALAESLKGASAKPRFYSACGVDDAQFRGENAAFAQHMRSLGHDIVYEELEGGHDWYFFDRAVRRGLEYFFGSDNKDTPHTF